MTNYYLIKSKDGRHFDESKASFYSTAPEGVRLEIVNELETRELTLNHIFSLNGLADMVCFADDIVLTHGWFEIVESNLRGFTSLGFSMYCPRDDRSKNFGFDLVKEERDIKTMARVEWISQENECAGVVECDTFTGCFFSVTSECLAAVSRVPLEGKNRLGELLYHVLLRRAGGRVLVSRHMLGHYAVSTKLDPKSKFNSQSYTDEKEVWEHADKKFNLERAVSRELESSFSALPFGFPLQIAVWGAGSIAKKLIDHHRFMVPYFITGLEEEDGRKLLGKNTHLYNRVPSGELPAILICVEGLEMEILDLIKAHLQVRDVYATKVERLTSGRRYTIERI